MLESCGSSLGLCRGDFLFGIDICIRFFEGIDISYAEKCVSALNNLNDSIIDLLCKYSELYCRDFCEYVGEDCPEINNSRDVLKYIQPLGLNIDPPRDEDVVLDLELNCTWEEEHGMQWVIKGNKILYVGSYDGISAYEEKTYYEKELGNYAFGNILCEEEDDE
jgi:hypothetical protein